MQVNPNFCSGPGSAQRQADRLAEEGVDVTTDSMGEMYINFTTYGWFPKRLPSEEGQVDSQDDSEDDD